MSQPAIQVRNLSKQYRLGAAPMHRSLRDQLSALAGRLIGRGVDGGSGEAFWALDDVSFDVEQGEVLGVIGRNGAGKSTLLKILSRITTPTRGEARLHGRVGSLLEVGTGFHPELSGRENIYLNGSILGLRRAEIERKFDEIVAFAEIDRFIDTAVKRYSSGMYVRLAFAVAAHLEPEILIVDEVLAVGDAAFQKRCIGKMSEVAKGGRTVLFVSHNMVAVQSLCTRALYLKDGRVVMDGSPHDVVAKYLQTANSSLLERTWSDEDAPTDGNVTLRAARIAPAAPLADGLVTVRTPLVVEFEYYNGLPGALLNLSVTITNIEGQSVFNTIPAFDREWYGRPFEVGLYRSSFEIPGDLLNDGSYQVNLLVVQDQNRILFSVPEVLSFEVQDHSDWRSGAWLGQWVGVVRPLLQWRTEQLVPQRMEIDSIA
jgi:lipopolysaccharide transport system ATP-binding protein